MNVVDALAQLLDARLVRNADDPSTRSGELVYQFAHALTQDAAYALLMKHDRARLHRVVGEVIERAYPDRLDENAARLAQHYAEAGEDSKTLEFSARAGDFAARVNANAEAVRHYTLALETAKRLATEPETLKRLHLRRGRVLELSGRYGDALENYDQMTTYASEHADRSLELASLVARATLRSTPTPVADAALGKALSEQALALARELGDRQTEAKVLWTFMLLNNFAAQLHEAVRYGEESLVIARELGLREQIATTQNDLFRPYASIGEYELARTVTDESRAFWRETGNLPMLADNLSRSARIGVALGEFDRAIEFSEEACQISQTIGNLWGQSFCRMFVGYAYLARGDMTTGIETMKECIRLAEESGFVLPLVATCADLGWVYGTLGAVDRGLTLARAAHDRAEQRVPLFRAWTLACLARLDLMAGHLDEARAHLEEGSAAMTEDWAQHAPIELPLAEAELAMANEEYARANDVIDRLLAPLRSFRLRFFLSEALYLKGRALIALGQLDQASQVLRQAHEGETSLGSRRTLWQIYAALSDIEIKRGNRTEASKYRAQANSVIEFIVAHTPAEFQASFLGLPDVRRMMNP